MSKFLSSKCVFSIGFLILFPVITFLFAQIYMSRSYLDNEIVTLKSSFENELQDAKNQFTVVLQNVTQTFDKRFSQLKNLTETDHEVLGNLSVGFTEEMNLTISLLNQSIREESDQVNEKVENLTVDVGTYVNTTTDQFNSQGTLMAVQFAGTFTILGVLIFMWHVSIHLRGYNEPLVQRRILAMLWMVPIYCITSFFSLVFISIEEYLAILKDFYEAYCIFMFLSFLIAVLGRGDRTAVVSLLATQGKNLASPFHFFGLCGKIKDENPHDRADSLLHQCQLAALQFVILRPVTSISMLLANTFTNSNSHTVAIWDVRCPQFYINLIVNASVFIAVSGLYKFYKVVRDDLVWCQPFPKFLCIKGVVFMTFWQGLVISFIANSLFEQDNDAKDWSKQAQNFIICIEMFFFSIVHLYVFPPEEWEEGYRPAETVRRKFGDNIALRDFVQDVRLVLQSRSKRKSNKSSKKDPFMCPPDEKLNALQQLDDEDDLTFINRIMKEAEKLKLEEDDSLVLVEEAEPKRPARQII